MLFTKSQRYLLNRNVIYQIEILFTKSQMLFTKSQMIFTKSQMLFTKLQMLFTKSQCYLLNRNEMY